MRLGHTDRTIRFVLLLAVAGPSVALGQAKVWTTNADFETGSFTNTVDNPADQVQLGSTRVSKNAIVWSDNYYPSWVVKIDGATGKQLGRYDAALVYVNNDIKQGATGARPPKEYCDWGSKGNCPGRITTDTNADVWIVNRAFGSQGTLSKFSGDINHCIDRNHNGVIDTSNDANGNGIIDPNDPKEFFGQNDECILTTIPVGAVNEVPRGVAVDRYGKVWVANYNSGKFYRFDPSEPVTLEATVNSGGNPYSLATGGDYVFGSGAGGRMMRIHVKTLAVDYAPCNGCYGIVGDPSGKYAYCGSYFSGTGVQKGDFTKGTCETWQTQGQNNTAVTLDLAGNVWAAGYNVATVYKLSPTGQLLGAFPSGGGNPHGLSVDFQGFIWSVNDANWTMAKIDTNGKLIGAFSIAGPTNDNYAPYLYSDFTGLQVDRQSPFAKLGNWRAVWDAGVAGVPWQKVTFNTEGQGVVPQETTMKVLVRAANDMKSLGGTGFVSAANGAMLNGVTGRFVEVEVDMAGPGYSSAVLSDLAVVGPCPGGRGEKCCVGDVDCDDRNGCTLDSCPAPGNACQHSVKKACCNLDGDCDDKNVCTKDTCSGPGGVCMNAAILGCCNIDGDCADGNPCHAPKCSGPGGMCSVKNIPNCCNRNGDCDDGSACTIDLCSGPGGVCSHFAKGGCCNVDADCADNDACHINTCTGPGGTCIHASKPGCCNVDADCEDGNACTDDSCSGPGGQCLHNARVGCCNVPGDCDDKNACTSDTCTGPGGACQHQAIARCCNDSKQCEDGDQCTTDVCSGPGGSCGHVRVADCCNLDSDCDDNDVCSADTCSGPGGRCVHKPVGAGCCALDTDCDDKNACTTDVCAQQGSACQHNAVLNCCNVDGDCPLGASCQGHACVGGFGASVDGGGAGASGSGCGCVVGGGRSGQGGDGGSAAAVLALGLALALRTRRRPLPR